jgi:hypothetical protein
LAFLVMTLNSVPNASRKILVEQECKRHIIDRPLPLDVGEALR